jgi:hypothetical protein
MHIFNNKNSLIKLANPQQELGKFSSNAAEEELKARLRKEI